MLTIWLIHEPNPALLSTSESYSVLSAIDLRDVYILSDIKLIQENGRETDLAFPRDQIR